MASSLSARYFYVSGSELKSKFSGDAEKSVKFAFEIARKATMGGKQPVMVVFDEADSLFGDNSGEGKQSLN
jgi:SpoVK/Ycf46/Vps4 family AAA+-type ATPase